MNGLIVLEGVCKVKVLQSGQTPALKLSIIGQTPVRGVVIIQHLIPHNRVNSQADMKQDKEVRIMKGYYTASGYMGYANGTYILFASEDDYREWFLED